MPVIHFTIDCATSIVTITGTGFVVGSAIEVEDPNGYPVDFTIISFTSTQIVLKINFASPGTYCVRITPNTASIATGSFFFAEYD